MRKSHMPRTRLFFRERKNYLFYDRIVFREQEYYSKNIRSSRVLRRELIVSRIPVSRILGMSSVRLGRLSATTSAFFLCDMQEKCRPIRYYREIITVAQRMVQAFICLSTSLTYMHVSLSESSLSGGRFPSPLAMNVLGEG